MLSGGEILLSTKATNNSLNEMCIVGTPQGIIEVEKEKHHSAEATPNFFPWRSLAKKSVVISCQSEG